MSTLDQATMAGTARTGGSAGLSHSRLRRVVVAERPVVRVTTFAALALFGVLRWATLTKPAPGWRLAGMAGLSVAIVALGAFVAPALTDRAWYGGWHRVNWMARGWWRRGLIAFLVLLALCAMLALAGIPVSWIYHVRVATIARGVGNGLSALPGTLVPYLGGNPWVQIVIAMGPGLLLLGAALAVCTRAPSDLRRAAAALQLSALAVVPATVLHPQLVPYIQGLLLFVLVAAFMWGERVVSRRSGAALALVAAAALLATVLAPSLARHHPWFNYESLAGSLSPSHIESFDWAQRYGPYDWPRDGRTVMTVRARHADYWKAENLDVFNGFGWSEGVGPLANTPPAPAQENVRRWTQTITVSLQAMRTTDVIAAGAAHRPSQIDASVAPGVSAGTWISQQPLAPGSTYKVSTYSPRPSQAQLAAIPATAYPDDQLADYRVVELPSAPNGSASNPHYADNPQVEFPPFHSPGLALNLAEPFGTVGTGLVRRSPYARAYALATSLAAQSATPYAFVKAVERYLSPANGFSYDENVSSYRYPLEAFLFSSRRGYCQQFAGAMALLLRLGGIPARVATGFTSGIYSSATHQFDVSDRDAHAWVEVWFPRYGWVRFDPTPAVAPAIASTAPLNVRSGQGQSTSKVAARRNRPTGGGAGGTSAALGSGSPGVWVILLPVLGLLALAALGAMWLRGGRAGPDQLVAELERALARCGRPVSGGLTLHALEHRFRESPSAAWYLRRLRLAKYGAGSELPTGQERRALRAALASGLGITGRLRAWWALPPRRPARRERPA